MSVLKTKPRGHVEVVQDENEDTSVRDGHFTDKLVDIVCYTTPFYIRRYVVGGSILPTNLPTNCANFKGLRIKCISDRVILPTDLPTDHEKYGGSLKKLVQNSKFTDGFLTHHRRNKLK
jgi:hypothetical protein